MALQDFLVDHGRSVQVVGTAAVVLAVGWLSRRAQPKVIEGWTHSNYSVALKAISLLFLAFMTAATVFNGLSVFTQDWWVVPVFLLTLSASYVFAYEVFFCSLRWNEFEVQVQRFPLRPVSMKFKEVNALKFHSTTESVTLISHTGKTLWFPYGYRAGVARLFTQIRDQTSAAEA